MPIPILLTLFAILILLNALYRYGQYWKKKAAYALLLYGRNAQDREERKWAAERALIAGNGDATKLYALACPEKFDKELPLKPFFRKKIKCVFVDYYYSRRFHDWIAEEQWQFAQTVYLFKEGKDGGGPYFAQAFRALEPACEVTIMFMPCSTQERYYTRFISLSDFFLKFRGVRSGIDFITFTGERESKHTALRRDKVDECSNYFISENVRDKAVIICDDLLTTGKSLYSYAKNLERSGAKVVGAVFLAKTFLPPPDRKVKWKVWKHFLFS